MLETIQGGFSFVIFVIYIICGWKLCSLILAKLGVITLHASFSDWFWGRFLGAVLLGWAGILYYGIIIIVPFFTKNNKSNTTLENTSTPKSSSQQEDTSSEYIE